MAYSLYCQIGIAWLLILQLQQHQYTSAKLLCAAVHLLGPSAVSEGKLKGSWLSIQQSLTAPFITPVMDLKAFSMVEVAGFSGGYAMAYLQMENSRQDPISMLLCARS